MLSRKADATISVAHFLNEWLKNCSYVVARFEGMTKWLIEVDDVRVVASIFFDDKITRFFKFVNNAMCRTFANTDEFGYLADPHVRVPRYADKHMRVIRQKRPVIGWGLCG
jgi:hypothetical protein